MTWMLIAVGVLNVTYGVMLHEDRALGLAFVLFGAAYFALGMR